MRVKGRRPSYPRVPCIVPGCKRGTTRLQPLGEDQVALEHPDRPGNEWICGPHWRRVPLYLKRRRTKLTKRWERLNPTHCFWHLKPGSLARLDALRLEKLIPRLWDRMVAIAKGEDEPLGAGIPAGLGEELRRLAL